MKIATCSPRSSRRSRSQIIELEDLRSDLRGLVDSGDVAGDGCWRCGSRLLTIEDRTRS